jgi:peptide/nickel transport system permease protein
MSRFITKRILSAIVVLVIVTIVTFLLVQIMPGDPARIMLGLDATPEQVQELRSELWLDRPLAIQYIHWLGNALQGDLGRSIIYQESVTSVIAAKLPVTLHLSLLSLIFSTFIGIAFGILCAIRRGTILDSFLTVIANIGIAVPIFWLGILGIYLFGLKLGWLPIYGYTSPFENLWKSTAQLVMPVFCMTISSLAMLTRQTRSSMLEVIRQDYIRTAWSKGLKERVIVTKHALKNALIPIVTLLGLNLRTLIGGSVLIETVFNIPGMGRLMVSSVFSKDFIVVQAITLLIAIIVLAGNLLVDISYGWLDPKIRYE